MVEDGTFYTFLVICLSTPFLLCFVYLSSICCNDLNHKVDCVIHCPIDFLIMGLDHLAAILVLSSHIQNSTFSSPTQLAFRTKTEPR